VKKFPLLENEVTKRVKDLSKFCKLIKMENEEIYEKLNSAANNNDMDRVAENIKNDVELSLRQMDRSIKEVRGGFKQQKAEIERKIIEKV
jgi:hypothetical protein